MPAKTHPDVLPFPDLPADEVTIEGQTFAVRAMVVDAMGRPLVLPPGARVELTMMPTACASQVSGCSPRR